MSILNIKQPELTDNCNIIFCLQQWKKAEKLFTFFMVFHKLRNCFLKVLALRVDVCDYHVGHAYILLSLL